MTQGNSRKNVLFLQHTIDGGSAMLRPIVDDVDLLAGSRHDRGLDPDSLLPPLSKNLMPTRVGHRTVIGSCCVVGCGSLSVRIRRDGQVVVWEPAEPRGRTRESVRRTYRFELGLGQYLDAIDAAADDRPGEGRGRRVARAVTILLREMAELLDDQPQRPPCVDGVSAYPYNSASVSAALLGPDHGQTLHEIHPRPAETDERFVRRVYEELHKHLGNLPEPPRRGV
jgi:hypothetical protein